MNEYEEIYNLSNKARELMKRKAQAYNHGSSNPVESLSLSASLLGISVESLILSRVVDKVSRLASMMRSGNSPDFESVEDTCIDLLNYTGLFWQAYNRSRAAPSPSEYPAILPGVHKEMIDEFEQESNYLGVLFD